MGYSGRGVGARYLESTASRAYADDVAQAILHISLLFRQTRSTTPEKVSKPYKGCFFASLILPTSGGSVQTGTISVQDENEGSWGHAATVDYFLWIGARGLCHC